MTRMDESDSPEARLAEMRERLEATKEAVARARSELADASSTTRSKDRSVEVTVGPQGELRRVRFLDEKYRTMDAAELGAAVLEAANKGRAAMARRVMDSFAGIDIPAQNADGLAYRPPDWEQIFGSALKGNRRGKTRKPRTGRSAGSLHDEIVEDGGDE
jgi:DNA-binding protein YbaB